MTRTPFIAGNWKMFKTSAEAEAYVDALAPLVADVAGVDVGICVPFTSLQASVARAEGTGIDVFAQNMHEAPEGAFTGEISAAMLTELGVDGVVLGHSERRQHFGETDRALQHKLPAALAAGLHPILCVGETEEERERGDTERRLRHQVQEALHGLGPEDIAKVTIAYEPIWAIGTGKVATRRAGPGGHRVRSCARRRPRARRRPTSCASSTAGPSRRRTRRSSLRCPTSTARSSAGRRWIPSRSPRSSAPPQGPDGDGAAAQPQSSSSSTAGAWLPTARATRCRSRRRRSSTTSGRATRTRR